MRAAGYSYGEIATELEITRGYAHVLVNGKRGILASGNPALQNGSHGKCIYPALNIRSTERTWFWSPVLGLHSNTPFHSLA